MSRTTMIVLGLVLLTLGGISALVYYFQPDHDWQARYDLNDDEPFDISLTKKVLENSTTLSVLRDSLDLPADGTGTVVWIEGYANLSDADNEKLFDFIRKGGKAFVAADGLSQNFVSQLDSTMDSTYMDWSGEYNVYYNSIKFRNYYADTACFYITDQVDEACLRGIAYGKYKERSWRHFDLESFDSKYEWSTAAWLETNSRDEPVAIDIEVGKGRLTLCSTPLLLTNIYMCDSSVFVFNNTLMSAMDASHIYMAALPDPSPRPRERDGSINPDKSPLSFVLQERTLRSAWYLLLATGLLFLVFGSRRKQRVIGYYEAKKNSSMVHADQVGALYRTGAHLHELGQSEVRWFLYRLKERFGLVIKPEDIARKKNIDQIAEVTGANWGDVSVLANQLDKARNYVHSLEELKDLSAATHQFHKKYI